MNTEELAWKSGKSLSFVQKNGIYHHQNTLNFTIKWQISQRQGYFIPNTSPSPKKLHFGLKNEAFNEGTVTVGLMTIKHICTVLINRMNV